MFQYSQADLDLQIAALPMLLQYWLNWMMVVIILMPLLFFRRPQGRVAIGTSVLLLAAAIPLGRIFGISNFFALLHLLIWTPLVMYFCYQLREKMIPIKSFFGIWSLVMVATVIISLVFDIRDFSRWLMGERGVIQPSANSEIPWITLVFILITLLLAAGYVLRKFPKKDELT